MAAGSGDGRPTRELPSRFTRRTSNDV